MSQATPRRLQALARQLCSAPARVYSDKATDLLRSIFPDCDDLFRMELAAAYQLNALFGFDDLCWNHISARNNGSSFLITPGTSMFEHIQPDDLVDNKETDQWKIQIKLKRHFCVQYVFMVCLFFFAVSILTMMITTYLVELSWSTFILIRAVATIICLLFFCFNFVILLSFVSMSTYFMSILTKGQMKVSNILLRIVLWITFLNIFITLIGDQILYPIMSIVLFLNLHMNHSVYDPVATTFDCSR